MEYSGEWYIKMVKEREEERRHEHKCLDCGRQLPKLFDLSLCPKCVKRMLEPIFVAA